MALPILHPAFRFQPACNDQRRALLASFEPFCCFAEEHARHIGNILLPETRFVAIAAIGGYRKTTYSDAGLGQSIVRIACEISGDKRDICWRHRIPGPPLV